MRPSGYATRPDYRIDLWRSGDRIRVRRGDVILADSTDALLLDEQDHALIIYFPRADVMLDRLATMPGRLTHCPYKGDARYWASAMEPGAPVAWSYDAPYPEVGDIAGHIAFYADRVTIEKCAAGYHSA